MLLFEEYTALLLTAHAIFALLSVALSTHLVLWLRPYLRGNFGNRRAVVRFSGLSAAAYGLTLLLGMALYPTYKVRVRAEFLENPSRIRKSAELEVRARKQVREQEQRSREYRLGPQTIAPGDAAGDALGDAAGDALGDTSVTPDDRLSESDARIEAEEIARVARDKIEQGEKLTRWFDVKEHWALLGLLLTLAVCGILRASPPGKESKVISKAVFGMALGAAAIAWSAAIIGLATAAAHSVVAL